jgi:beta-glucosidase
MTRYNPFTLSPSSPMQILKAVKRAQVNGLKFDQPEISLDTPELRSVLHDSAAASTVLLKNESSVLPLEALDKVAAKSSKKYPISVIGPNSHPGSISGGGSASLLPSYCVSVKDAVMTEAAKSGIDAAKVGWAQGVYAHLRLPSLSQYLQDLDGKPGHATLSFYDNTSLSGTPVWSASVDTRNGHMLFIDSLPDYIPEKCSCRLEATFEPSRSGQWEFGLYSVGLSKLFINDELVADNWSEANWQQGTTFFGLGSTEVKAVYTVDKEKTSTHKFRIDMSNDPTMAAATPFPGGRGGIGFGGVPIVKEEQLRSEAVELAKESEKVILVVGLNGDWETEGDDRETMKLPPGTDDLVRAVMAANANTVVVMQSGMPVEMPWIDQCSTLLQSWYAGNEHGNAVTSVLFGRHAPHGRLPLTYPKRLQDCPNYLTFPETHHNGLYGTLDYNEGSNVGYRFYSKTETPVLFEFGYGLSYSTFAWENIRLLAAQPRAFDEKTILVAGSQASQDIVWTVQVRIVNTGHYPSKEVVQLYSSRLQDKAPIAELRNFATTQLLEPGQHQDVTLRVSLSDLSIWDERYPIDSSTADYGCWLAKAGTYKLSLGRSCQKMESSVEVKVGVSEELRWKGLVTRLA